MKKVLNKRSKIMNKLISMLLVGCMLCSLPVKAEPATTLEELEAKVQTGFDNVLTDMKAAAEVINDQNEKLRNLNERVTRLEKRRKKRAVEALRE